MTEAAQPLPVPPHPGGPSLFGRTKLVQEIRQRLQDGHKVLLEGPEGIGKSAVLRALLASGLGRHLGRTLVLCPETTGVRTIVDAAEEHGRRFQAPASGEAEDQGLKRRRVPGRPKGGVRERRSVLYGLVRQGRWLFVLDHLASRDPGIRRVLEYLFDYDVLALGAAHGTQATELGNVAKTLWRWDRVKIPPLGAAACQQLVEQLTRGWTLEAKVFQAFCHQLLQLAQGNPGVLVELCRRAAARLAAGTATINAQHLWWDWLGERARGTGP